MATKDVTDVQVCVAVVVCRGLDYVIWPYDLLSKHTCQPVKVCYNAMRRTAKRGYLEYGTSLRTAWLTDKGLDLLKGTQ